MGRARPGVTDEDPSDADATALRARLLEGAPRRVALLGERAASLLVRGEGTADAATAESASPRWLRFASLADCQRAAPEARRADAALLVLSAGASSAAADTPRAARRPPGDGAERALGVACRLYPARLLLLVEGEALPEATAFAFGFRRLGAFGGARLYEYSLSDYKAPPEWLNSRFWAHPERFDLDPDATFGGEYEDADEEDGADEGDEDEGGGGGGAR